ncbi:MAG TPA: PQQ-binding-like beta-propeller repeat protein [Polyangiaceae bacterium]|nr:PQQ-binding-like beta-propeller repeat protein [Polyangiaceae bacterium]
MRTSTDECPRCGAPLPGGVPGVSFRTCGYCHTAVEVDEPRPEERAPEPRALTQRPLVPGVVRFQYLAAASIVLCGLVVSLAHVLFDPKASPGVSPTASAASVTRIASTPAPPRERLRALAGVVLIELDARTDAFLVLATPLEGGGAERWLSAREPRSGRELWKRPLATTAAAENILRVPFGESVVVAQPGEVSRLDAATGSSDWQHPRTTNSVRACASGNAFGLLDAARELTAYSVANGSPVALRRESCGDVYASNAGTPNFAFVDAAEAARWLPSGSGFEVKRGLLPRQGSTKLVLGAEASGAASVGVLDGGRFLWHANVANEHPELAKLTSPPLAAARDDCVVVAYVANSNVVLSGFGLQSGERRWSTALPSLNGASDATVAGELAISRDGHVAYRAGSGEFWVLNVLNGAVDWTLHGKE